MTKGRAGASVEIGCWLTKQQVPPLRCAPIGMTIHILEGQTSCAFLYGKAHTQPCMMQGGRKSGYAPVPRRAGTGGMTILLRKQLYGCRGTGAFFGVAK